MKRFILLFASLLTLFALKTHAQNQRMLLLESFTNTSCGYCGLYNPAMDALIASNPDKIVAIKYHVNWPGANDPMYLHNTADNGSRTSYYNVTGVPHVVIDGTRFSGNPNQVTQSIINQLQAIESPMELRLTYSVNEEENTITVNVMGHVSTDIEREVKLYVGVIEREIHFSYTPGNNGERDFYSVMKKLLPSSSGQPLGILKANDYFAYTFTWELANIYDMDQLDAIAWVQSPNTKEVFQACGSSEVFEPFYANEACVNNFSNVKGVNCSGIVEPKIVLTNYGSNNLTSAVLDVFINGELLKTLNWSGNLASLMSEVVDLGEISFSVEDVNLLEVKINSVNDSDDEAPVNDVASIEIKGTPDIAGKALKVVIRTDPNPQETTWKVTNYWTGEVIAEGGPYEQAGHTYNEPFEITGDGCYNFTIYDAGGDGLTGSGAYGLKAGTSTVFSGKRFGDSESNEFYYEVVANVEEPLDAMTGIYPNPTSGMVYIVNEGEQVVTIYNMAGQRVYKGLSNGNLQIDLKVYGAGIYAIQVGNETQRVVVK